MEIEGLDASAAPACFKSPTTLSTAAQRPVRNRAEEERDRACAQGTERATERAARTNASDRLGPAFARRFDHGVRHVHVQRSDDHHDDAAALSSAHSSTRVTKRPVRVRGSRTN